MKGVRPKRVAELVHGELAQLIRLEVRDPRVGWVSITHVEVSRDLQVAKVFVTPLGGQGDPDEMLEGLEQAAGYLRRLLGRRMKLRYTPVLVFELDDGVDEAVRMTSMLDAMARDRGVREAGEE